MCYEIKQTLLFKAQYGSNPKGLQMELQVELVLWWVSVAV